MTGRYEESPARSLLQGMLVGAVMHSSGNILKSARVEQEMAQDGTYERHFDVVVASGKKFRVTVEEVTDGEAG